MGLAETSILHRIVNASRGRTTSNTKGQWQVESVKVNTQQPDINSYLITGHGVSKLSVTLQLEILRYYGYQTNGDVTSISNSPLELWK